MINKTLRPALWIFSALLAFSACAKGPELESRDEALALFENPPVEYRSVPFWVWNDAMTREQIEEQLADFRDKGLGGVFVHPRPGLVTPYLSEKWFSLFRHAVDIAAGLGMNVWIYDENSYPSGFAGGHVPAQMPDAVRAGLRLTRMKVLPDVFEIEPLLVQNLTHRGFQDVTADALAGRLGEGDYYVFDVVRQQPSPWHGGFPYVDLLRRDVTERFLEVTLEAYKEAAGSEFGRTIPGVFQDEAEISPAGGRSAVSFTPALFEEFQKRWGYDLKPHLASLFEDAFDFQKIRHNYRSVLLDLFIENWAKPYFQYCEDNNLVFTGHYWEHEWPVPRIVPDSLALAAYAHMPGIDILMNEYATGPHAQFGNARAVREIRSAAVQHGRTRTLAETYGASGWDLTFEDQKRIGDWAYALGVNFLNQHLSYATIRGARKRDHPPSFSYHAPWWGSYRRLADYFARLSAVLSLGRPASRVLVIEPTTSAWMYYTPLIAKGRTQFIGEEFHKFINLLEAERVPYDLASEKTLADFGRARFRSLFVGREAYDLVVIPPGMENMNSETVRLFNHYLYKGGKVISWVAGPEYVDAERSDDVRKMAGAFGDRWFAPGLGFEKLHELHPPEIVFSGLQNEDRFFHHHRKLRDADILFLVNTADDKKVSGTFRAAGGSVEAWDPFTGRTAAFPYKTERDGEVRVEFSLPPAGSLLLCIRAEAGEQVPEETWTETGIPLNAPSVNREALNVLTLDHCDLRIDGAIFRNLYFYDAQTRIFQANGFERNPWDHAVQFKTDILDRDSFPEDSGFESEFSFEIVGGGPHLATLRLAAERPDLFAVRVNGRDVAALPGEWWLDKAFGVYDIGGAVRPGRNTVSLRVKPFTLHAELESVYVLGDFRLEPSGRGFRILPPRRLEPGAWKDQGLPFYGGTVRYESEFRMESAPAPGRRIVVRLGDWAGSDVRLLVNGRDAGTAAFPPYECDITDFVRDGANIVAVVVTGTLKNTLGPHHGSPARGRAWPSDFRKAPEGGLPPGSAYDVLPYGLFENFRIVERRPAAGHNARTGSS